MMRSKKGLGKFFWSSLGMLGITLVYLILQAEPMPTDVFMGKIGYDTLSAKYDTEYALLFVDYSAKYSLPQAIRDLGENGGTYSLTFEGTVLNQDCGEYIFPLWNKGTDYCWPDPKQSLLNYFNDRLDNYLIQYPLADIPRSNYDFEMQDNKGEITILGRSREKMTVGIGRAGASTPNFAACNNFQRLSCNVGSACTNDYMSLYGKTEAEVNANLVSVDVLGKTVKVHQKAKKAFECVSLASLACAPDYNFEKILTFDWRCMTGQQTADPSVCKTNNRGQSARSSHSFGISVDINPAQNPICFPSSTNKCSIPDNNAREPDWPLKTDIPKCVVDAFQANGFVWGGYWNSVVDPMHFEWVGDPSRANEAFVDQNVDEDITSTEVDFSMLIQDTEFLDTMVTQEQIQAFLEKHTGVLSRPISGERDLPSKIIYDAAQDSGINPVVMLATLQKEQSLISKKNPGESALNWAAGCGCRDNSKCDTKNKGFKKQVACMADTFKNRYNDGEKSGMPKEMKGINYDGTCTKNPNKKGIDKLMVANAATYALFKYTPHTVDICLDKQPGGGNYLFAIYFRQYYKEIMGIPPSSAYATKYAMGEYKIPPNFKTSYFYDLGVYDTVKEFAQYLVENYDGSDHLSYVSGKLDEFNQTHDDLDITKYCRDYPVLQFVAEQYMDCYSNGQENCICQLSLDLPLYSDENTVGDHEIILYGDTLILAKRGDEKWPLEPGKRSEYRLPFVISKVRKDDHILELREAELKIEYKDNGARGIFEKADLKFPEAYNSKDIEWKDLEYIYVHKQSDGQLVHLEKHDSVPGVDMCVPDKRSYALCAEQPVTTPIVWKDTLYDIPIRI
ncbi:MAG: M15 family metallopeptidase, partial [Nanoarchaeota archaeon]|nr:M15 family metallopeptidase [Nanoarchaeota archaeon]